MLSRPSSLKKIPPPQEPEPVVQQPRREPVRQQRQAPPFMGNHREFEQHYEETEPRFEQRYEQKWESSVKIDVLESSGRLNLDVYISNRSCGTCL